MSASTSTSSRFRHVAWRYVDLIADRLSRRSFSAEDARRFAVELVGFLVFKFLERDLSPRYVYSCPAPVDAAWHEIVLATRFYSDMCDDLFGRIIHHDPEQDGNRTERLAKYAYALGVDWCSVLDDAVFPFTFFVDDERTCFVDQIQGSVTSRRARFASAWSSASWPPTFEIFVKALNGKTLTLNVRENDTVADVKYALSFREQGPPGGQRLIYAGRQLENDRTMKEYGLTRGSSLHLVLQLRGC